MSALPRVLIAPLVVLAAVSSFGIGLWLSDRLEAQAPPQVPGLLWPSPPGLGAFSLHDQYGERFGLEEMKGHWSFVFFGFTNCPDICPLTLGTLAGMEQDLSREAPEVADDTRIVFVSVDPERDDEQALASYVDYFGEGLLGVTGDPEQLEAFARQLGTVFLQGAPGQDGSYTVDHSARVLLIDPQGRLVAAFSPPHQAEELAERYRRIRSFIEEENA